MVKSISTLIITFQIIYMVMSGCGPSIKIGYDYDTEKDFASYETYDYLTTPDNTQMKELVLKRIKQALDRELSARGLKYSEDQPDLLIAMHSNVQSNLAVTGWGYSYGPYTVYWSSWGYHGAYGLQTREYNKGTLIVDFVDAKSREMVWRGIAQSALPEIPRSEQIEKIVNEAVSGIMKNYPPTVKK
jgi:hypothetical protein